MVHGRHHVAVGHYQPCALEPAGAQHRIPARQQFAVRAVASAGIVRREEHHHRQLKRCGRIEQSGGVSGEHTVVVKQCCCEHPGVGGPTCDPSAKTRDCCHKVVELSAGPGDQVGGLAATVRLPPYDPQALPPVLLPAVYALALPVSAPARHWYEHSERSFYGTRLYLRTQRLRL